ncbi:MAG: hypothetical protein HN855_03580 [Anaerolineae bacterium]|jgi:hypothetical protein|nr:hypothetical protein [Anaerolineae bacterium]MBT7070322.1 hypothetical protein [Anaerolineae bacterium]MBT7324217.1 hypothetical protein [Anaerolineae bacterium]
MDEKTIVTLSVSLFLAFMGYIAKYLNDLNITRMKERLERVNDQLRDLYGPLFSLNHVSAETWSAFSEEYCNSEDFRTPGSRGVSPQTEEAKKIWRHWMKHVFMPLNTEMFELITDHADLLEEKEMPESILQLGAHVQGYKGVLAAWEEGDHSRHMSLLPYPSTKLYYYAKESYETLKARQAKLLRLNKRA